MATFAEATAIKAIDTRTYSAYLHDAWTIGNVPHGGIVTSNVLAAVKLHFETALASYNQPHTITVHLEFLRKTSVGPAIILFQNSKLGRRTSTVHVVVTQIPRTSGISSATPTTCVVGYITQSNITTEEGISLPTGWSLSPPPRPVSSFTVLRQDEDPNWALERDKRYPNFRKAGQRVKRYFPREKRPEASEIDEWLCFSNGERLTQESLGFVADMMPQPVETSYTLAEIKTALGNNTALADQETLAQQKKQAATFWYPTLCLNLDIKKALPSEGVEFLFVRVQVKKIHKGRLDLDIVIVDEEGDLVATSTHVCLVLASQRNLQRSGGENQSKI